MIHPSCVSDHSSTINDNIFSIVSNADTKSGNILTQIADHFPQFLIVRKTAITNKTLLYYQHDYSKFDQEKFLADFNSLNFYHLHDNQSYVNIKFNKFLASLDEIVKKHAPLKMITKNKLKLQNKSSNVIDKTYMDLCRVNKQVLLL